MYTSDQKIECFPNYYSRGNDPIHFFAKNGNTPENLEILKNYINSNREKINIQNEKKFTPLMIACNNLSTTSSLECVETLLKLGADPNLKNSLGWSALTFMCCYSYLDINMECVKLLLKYKSEINSKDINGITPIMIVCSFLDNTSTLDCLEYLIEKRADVNLEDKRGFSPLKILSKRKSISDETRSIAIAIIKTSITN